MKFYITKHCKDRYRERVLGNTGNCYNLILRILSDLNTGKNITSKLSSTLPRFILYMKEQYGPDKGYNIIQKDHTFFILTKRKQTENLYDVLTCYIEFDTFKKFSNTCLSNQEIYLKLSMLNNYGKHTGKMEKTIR
jgi:hypothetical protein